MENEKNLRDNDEMEIDLLQLFYALKEDLVHSGGHDYWRGTGRSIQQISDYTSVFFY